MNLTYTLARQGWLLENLPAGAFQPPSFPEESAVERRANLTDKTGRHPLWEGYKAVYKAEGQTRSSANVRTQRSSGRFFAWLAERRSPNIIAEFGTAFGVSGMYWLAGLNRVPAGHLCTFEPNDIWAGFAEENLASISPKFTLTRGTFEENAERVLAGRKIDLAFIDAIHTSAFVLPQFEIVRRHASPGAIVIFDDINFSDDMRACWKGIAASPELVASLTIEQRLGVVELP